MLKITHFASGDLWAGAEKQLFTLVSELIRHHDVEVIVVLLNEGELAEKLKNQGIDVRVFDESINHSLGLLSRIAGFLRTEKPDIIHTHGYKLNVLASAANLLAQRASNVRTIHGAPEHEFQIFSNLPGYAAAFLDRWTGRLLCKKIVAVTEDLEVLLQQVFQKSRLMTIVNGIDIGNASFNIDATDRTRGKSGHNIGIACRLSEVKRVDIFLQIADILVAENSRDWHFHVYGDGPLLPGMKNMAKKLNIVDRVEFHGHAHDMERRLSQLDLLIICSDHEAMPMVALESIIAGTPVLAHAVGGLKGLLSDHADILLVDENVPAQYAQKIKNYFDIDNPSIISDLQSKIKNHYSAERNAANWMDLYKEVI